MDLSVKTPEGRFGFCVAALPFTPAFLKTCIHDLPDETEYIPASGDFTVLQG